jgi:glycine/D-amino acid oxidase-like deaminating enzyme
MTISLDTGAHWRPEGPGAYLSWAGAEPGGVREPSDDVPSDPDYPALVIDAVSTVSPFWAEVAETLTRASVTVQAGLYDLTPDARPIIGRAGAVQGLYIHAGYSGHGIMGSASGGRLLADLVTGREREATNPYRLSRFADGPAPSAKKPL